MAFFTKCWGSRTQGFLLVVTSALMALYLLSLALTALDTGLLRENTMEVTDATKATADVEPDCDKSPPPKKLPPWLPPPGKYLLEYCHLYGWSNKLYCAQRALILAALLNRTLIMPSDDVCVGRSKGTTMDLMFDIPHMRKCLLRKVASNSSSSENQTEEKNPLSWELEEQANRAKEGLGTGMYVISLPEYLSLHKKQQLHVDLLLCENQGQWWSACPPKTCTAGNLVSHPPPSPPPVPLFSSSRSMSLEEVRTLAAATSSVEVLSFGDTFYGNFKDLAFAEVLPVAQMFDSTCDLLFQPAQEVFELAAATKAWLNGSSYAAVHFRRGDFGVFCKRVKNCTYWSVQQAADCLASELGKAQIRNLFVASDAKRDETEPLAAELHHQGVQMFKLSTPNESSWFSSMLAEKLICAQASMFIFQDFSTFSYNVLQMRKGLKTNSCRDKALCAGWKAGFTPLSQSYLKEIPLKGL